jgi:hypothetical protein
VQPTEAQSVHFPFEVTQLECTIVGLRATFPERSVLLTLAAEEPIKGVWFSDRFQSNFVYLPPVTSPPGQDLHFEVKSTTPWTSAEFALRPWGAQAPATDWLGETLRVSATGVIGEERREYTVSYEWPIAKVEG